MKFQDLTPFPRWVGVLIVLGLVGTLVSGISVPLYAGAYEWGGLGTRAQSMGGAFIGLADDWTAIYWNPAGLAQLRGAGWGFEFLSPHVIITDGNSLSNLTAANMETRYRIDTFAQYSGLEPTQFENEEVKLHFYNPSGLGGYWQWKGFVMGLAYYIPVGYYLDWEDTINYGTGTIEANLFQQMSLQFVNLSIARQVHPRLSLGTGLELIYGGIDYRAEKSSKGTGDPLGDYDWDYRSKCAGTGLEGILGGLFKVTDKLNLGGVYRTGSTIRLKGRADTHLTLAAAPIDESSEFVQQFPHPSTWGLGLAYKPKPKLTLTTDFQRTNWSEFKIDVDYGTEGSALTDKDYKADWHDSNRYRCGVEYKPTKRWALRGGYFFDESPLYGKSVSFSNIADVDRHNIVLGTGYEWENAWQLDFLYGHAWGYRTARDVNYSQRINSLGITVSKKF